MATSDTKLRQAKPKDKPYRIADEKGLYLEVRPNGSKYWRHKYRFQGKEKRISHGVYPEVSLAAARNARDEARRLLREDIDPSQYRQTTKAQGEANAQNTFAAVSDEWYAKQLPNWAESTAKKRRALINNDLLPWLGKRPIADLDTHDLLGVLQRIESRKAIDTAHNARQVLNQIFRYAKQTRKVTSNPATDLAGAIQTKPAVHRPAITEPEEFGRLLAAIDTYSGTFPIQILLKLCPLLFQRPGEMAAMRWDEIDFESAIWHVPADTMKMKEAHDVPLPEIAVELLEALHPLTGNREFAFPNARKPTSHATPATINKALRKLGVDTQTQHCAHGFRASARTIMDEVLGFRVEWIEQQLAHKVRDSLGRAYNRTKHLPQRKEMMQAWADYLDTLRGSRGCDD
ncbi:integrase arm-type DNA-binding domain-containing protein [Gilvimarinus sp. SDUM040013]|uniref:Integrase arm-type DNA-binding domain-containing protein n=1 Tax=Gilvimarinus gilvus TaxID=3058038 RepID=A0ABU4S0B0_9GAMM|nr:integrase arm-type DNA-binding domain-containing protein [Gilvimarinus sp. SDUM040013]MDO3387950.1 integrase arm-type DNA-binding domain-containing protein [Gilvimarinus sp. SDUM040013]MDX6848679.1 integrase arm-type DNA-binding domain-containing protein [Gilvimarinus sp. SDUM040013]